MERVSVPDDLLQKDLSTFPTQDPRLTAELAKQHKQALAAQKQADKEEAAAVKKALATAPPPPKASTKNAPPSVKQEIAQRELKAHKIRLYYDKLGHKLSSKCPKTLPKTDEGLDEILQQIECELHSAGGIEQAGQLYLQSLVGLEELSHHFNPLGLVLSGPAASLSSTVAHNKEKWNDLMTEVAIANAEWFMVSVHQKCIFLVGDKCTFFVQNNACAAS